VARRMRIGRLQVLMMVEDAARVTRAL